MAGVKHGQHDNSADAEEAEPFRLLDLPQEIQENVYTQYHGSYDLELGVTIYWHKKGQKTKPFLEGMPAYKNLESSCSKLRADSFKIRKQSYTGTLRYIKEKPRAHFILSEMKQSQHANWILKATTRLEFPLEDSTLFNRLQWKKWMAFFPVTSELRIAVRHQKLSYINHVEQFRLLLRGIHTDPEPMLTQFRYGGKDEWFRQHTAVGEIAEFRKLLIEERRPVVIYFKSIVTFPYGDRDRRDLVSAITARTIHLLICVQFVIFRSTTSGWDIIERGVDNRRTDTGFESLAVLGQR